MEDFIRWYSPRDWIEGNEEDDDDMKDGWEVEENETKVCVCVCLVVHDSKVFHSIMRAKVGANWFSLYLLFKET